jgi:hypothetical protein
MMLEDLEARVLLTGTPTFVATGAGNGLVQVTDASTGSSIISFRPYDNAYVGGLSVAAGDVDGDGTPEIITAPTAQGALPLVKVFSITGIQVASFFAYDQAFKGGVSVASADFTGDGHDDIVTAAGPGGGPHVRVFNADSGLVVRNFFPFATTFSGGVNVAVGDVNNDSVSDIIVAQRQGGSPIVKAYNGANNQLLLSTNALANNTTFAGGIHVASGDVNNDGHDDIIVSTGTGILGTVSVISGANASRLMTFTPVTTSDGITVASVDQDGDGNFDIVVGSTTSTGRRVTIYKGTNHTVLKTFSFNGTPFQGFNLVGYTA